MKGQFTADVEKPYTSRDFPKFTDLSDKELIPYCLENHRPAWEEFFRRHIPFIKKTIKRKLVGYGHAPERGSNDAVWDIHEKIVVKLYKCGILSQCVDPDGFHLWLKKIVQNQVTDWVKEQNRNKRLPQKQSEDFMVYISAPLKKDSNATFEDFLEDKNESFENLATELESILDKMERIEDEKKMWILRLSLISLLPLTRSDLEALAKFNGLSLKKNQQQIDKILEHVKIKERKRTEALGRSIILWHDISRLQYRLSTLEKPSTETPEIKTVEKEIADKNKRRENLLNIGNSLVRPANRDIATLVGIPENKAEQISTFLSRARKELRSESGGYQK